ncbi:MAG: HEAT repeat domain-containing protein [SAR202 cluster bacterium]|nr:HEAT repeat domain-containing protein [SAR202 cluster bacterium]
MLNPRRIKLVSMILAIHVLICFAIVKTEAQEIEDLKQVIRKFSDDSQVHQNAIESLVDLGKPAVSTLIQALQDQDVRRRVALALGKIGSVDAVPALIQALQDKDINVRASATRALKEIGTLGALNAVKGYESRQ